MCESQFSTVALSLLVERACFLFASSGKRGRPRSFSSSQSGSGVKFQVTSSLLSQNTLQTSRPYTRRRHRIDRRITKLAENECARDRVFGITELAEAILTELSIVDLIHAKQACKCWKSFIEESVLLGELLFTKSVTNSPLHLHENLAMPTLSLTPAPPRQHSLEELLDRIAVTGSMSGTTRPVHHPWLTTLSRESSSLFPKEIFWNESFLDSFITQPPVAEVTMVRTIRKPEKDSEYLKLVKREAVRAPLNGVRFRDVVDLVKMGYLIEESKYFMVVYYKDGIFERKRYWNLW